MTTTAVENPPASPAPFANAFGTLRPQSAIPLGLGLEVVLVHTDGAQDPAPGDRLAFLPEAPESVMIEEAGGGNVPVLKARNLSEMDVFVLAGQLIRGGKQNRGINADALVPAKGVIELPVTCVEQGRWSGNTVREPFRAAGIEPSFLRSEKMRSVHAMKRRSRSEAHVDPVAHHFSADQGAVWASISDFQRRMDRENASSDLLCSLDRGVNRNTQEQTKALRDAWQGASGMLVFLDGEFISGDVMGCPRWFQVVREQLLDSALASRELVRVRRGGVDGSDLTEDELIRLIDTQGPGAAEALLRRRLQRRELQAMRGAGAARRTPVSSDHMARSILTDAMSGTWAVHRGVGAERAWQLEHPFLEAAACVSPSGRPLHLLIGTARTPQVFMN